MRRGALAAAAVAALMEAGCSTVPRFEAADDIHAFLVSIRDGDAAAFDRYVDRPALKAQLRSRLIAASASSGTAAALGAVLGGGLVDLGVDALVRPDVFRAIALKVGYDPSRPLPGVLAVARFTRPLEPGRACIVTRDGGPCVLVFRNEEGVWRLVGFEGRIGFGAGGKVDLSS